MPTPNSWAGYTHSQTCSYLTDSSRFLSPLHGLSPSQVLFQAYACCSVYQSFPAAADCANGKQIAPNTAPTARSRESLTACWTSDLKILLYHYKIILTHTFMLGAAAAAGLGTLALVPSKEAAGSCLEGLCLPEWLDEAVPTAGSALCPKGAASFAASTCQLVPPAGQLPLSDLNPLLDGTLLGTALNCNDTRLYLKDEELSLIQVQYRPSPLNVASCQFWAGKM